MAVTFDARFLFFLFDPVPAGNDEQVAKVLYLFDQLNRSKEAIIIPTPALAELLVGAGERASDVLSQLDKKSIFQVEPFGQRAAVELAAWEFKLLSTSAGKRDGLLEEPYQKIKVDRQICAIAKVAGSERIYSQDRALRHHASRLGLTAFGIDDLPSVPISPQSDMQFE